MSLNYNFLFLRRSSFAGGVVEPVCNHHQTRDLLNSARRRRSTPPQPPQMEETEEKKKTEKGIAMDACEATRIVMSRVQSLDPENAAKIMGYILIQDDGDKEMIRLALGHEALLLSRVEQLRARLGLPPAKPSSPVAPNGPFPPRVAIPNVSYAAALNGEVNGNQLSFVDDSVVDPIMSPSGGSDSLIFSYGEDSPSPQPHPFHRRSCSVNDAVFLSNLEEGGGFGWRPCMYFARGFCKNGSSCKFLHGENGGEVVEEGSPSSAASGFDEFMRIKAMQQHRLAAMPSRGHHHSFPYSKSVNILNDNQRCGPRNGLSQMGLGAGFSSCSRQIYLTFPADSTFKEEDVSSYFGLFGPVQDVRIPYQPKRMFGFVTFVYPETVKLILAKGNPHYVCDSRVLVKPYKEKGKIPEKKQFQQQYDHLERGEYSTSLSPSGIDSRELFDVPIGSRMLFNTQDMMLRRQLEQEAEIQHALELQTRRMNNLQLVENPQLSHGFLPSLFTGVPISSPRQQQLLMSQNFLDATTQDGLQELDGGLVASKSPAFADDDDKLGAEETESSIITYILNSKKHQHVNDDDSYPPESLEHILPENLLSSPKKSATEQQSAFSVAASNNITVTNKLPNSSPHRMASLFYSETASH
ncbi:Zinc finger CCCH domain-containing protein 46 [Striga hermonthica]|uniref:Zinc finger CCCH domain-containing protein 46 n=1 Tax=Striga hermonthica TaxID=68872 RepID=A0A9N7ML74_STRHE|nr:Zinc finger CCCH domain-containing protein 46 [Striga hermonthica]